jgi:hypothetical protein
LHIRLIYSYDQIINIGFNMTQIREVQHQQWFFAAFMLSCPNLAVRKGGT